MNAFAHLRSLWDKIDAFGARVQARYDGEIVCALGCTDCCRQRLTITGIEADAIAAHVRLLPRDERERLLERVRTGCVCAALEVDGRCAIYAARPIVCRTHGLPIGFDATTPVAAARTRLPVVDACPKNFGGRDLASIEPRCILDQATLSTVLAAIDAAAADAAGRARGERYELAAVLADAALGD